MPIVGTCPNYLVALILLNQRSQVLFTRRKPLNEGRPFRVSSTGCPDFVKRDRIPCCGYKNFLLNFEFCQRAGVAQLVEQLICNQRVGGSSPFASSKTPLHQNNLRFSIGEMAEWLMAADCKSAAPCELRRFESSSLHHWRLQALLRRRARKGCLTQSCPMSTA